MNFEEVFRTIYSSPLVVTIVILVFVNYLVGIFAAIKTGTFKVDQLAEFTTTMVLPLVGGGSLLQLVLWGVSGDYLPEQMAQLTGKGVWTTVIVSLLWRFLRHLKVLAPQLVPFPIDPAVNQDTATTSILETGTGPKAT